MLIFLEYEVQVKALMDGVWVFGAEREVVRGV